jgi:hypothetical protein
VQLLRLLGVVLLSGLLSSCFYRPPINAGQVWKLDFSGLKGFSDQRFDFLVAFSSRESDGSYGIVARGRDAAVSSVIGFYYPDSNQLRLTAFIKVEGKSAVYACFVARAKSGWVTEDGRSYAALQSEFNDRAAVQAMTAADTSFSGLCKVQRY